MKKVTERRINELRKARSFWRFCIPRYKQGSELYYDAVRQAGRCAYLLRMLRGAR